MTRRRRKAVLEATEYLPIHLHHYDRWKEAVIFKTVHPIILEPCKPQYEAAAVLPVVQVETHFKRSGCIVQSFRTPFSTEKENNIIGK